MVVSLAFRLMSMSMAFIFAVWYSRSCISDFIRSAGERRARSCSNCDGLSPSGVKYCSECCRIADFIGDVALFGVPGFRPPVLYPFAIFVKF